MTLGSSPSRDSKLLRAEKNLGSGLKPGVRLIRIGIGITTRRPKPTRIIVPEFFEMAQSRAATGGVYKGQRRIQSEFMTRPYKEFLVHGQ
uniref:Uncharacterized protein n=1 Tax=Globodera pallida TaxID=36090 RepID=A0A183CKH5_GLOPA